MLHPAKLAARNFLSDDDEIIASEYVSLYHSSVIGSSYEKTGIDGYLVFYITEQDVPILAIFASDSAGETYIRWADVLPRYHKFYGTQNENYIVYDCCNFESSNGLIFEDRTCATNFYRKLKNTFEDRYGSIKVASTSAIIRTAKEPIRSTTKQMEMVADSKPIATPPRVAPKTLKQPPPPASVRSSIHSSMQTNSRPVENLNSESNNENSTGTVKRPPPPPPKRPPPPPPAKAAPAPVVRTKSPTRFSVSETDNSRSTSELASKSSSVSTRNTENGITADSLGAYGTLITSDKSISRSGTTGGKKGKRSCSNKQETQEDSNISGPIPGTVRKQGSVYFDKETGDMILENMSLPDEVLEGYAESICDDMAISDVEKKKAIETLKKKFESKDQQREIIKCLLQNSDKSEIIKMLMPKKKAAPPAPAPASVRQHQQNNNPQQALAPAVPTPAPVSKACPPPPTIRKIPVTPPPPTIRRPPPPPTARPQLQQTTGNTLAATVVAEANETAESNIQKTNLKSLPNALQDSIKAFSKNKLRKVDDEEQQSEAILSQFDLTSSIKSFLAKRRRCISDNEDSGEDSF